MQEQTNPLLCDIESGLCEVAVDQKDTTALETPQAIEKPLRILYFTDPICSSCWGIEPQWRKLKLAYGNDLEIEYKMGGLLKDWSYNSGQISKPSDVAGHWDEVSVHYDMPIDGDIWLEDPLHSSYPPSIAFKAAQMQNKDKAILFLREIREMVFLQKKNITKWEYLEAAAKKVGLNILEFKTDYEGKAKELFEEDVQIGKDSGVRGFPTMIFTNMAGEQEFVYGSKTYNFLESVVLKLYPEATKSPYNKDWNSIFLKYNSLTVNEYAQTTDTKRTDSEKLLNDLTAQGKLEKLTTKNGAMWTVKNIH
ncbi:DsbA family protein [Dyadobacter sp. 3J3]|uniref:DsbA family protein n=1 Tax=Dyadobacter sp. 3J3 TaxID=2606600 RepID=UPI001357CED6|nr:DsbA family protein [Dyadobacter sp. 3J3]